MANDIVEQLLEYSYDTGLGVVLKRHIGEAAGEILRLREKLAARDDWEDYANELIERKEAEIELLRKIVEKR